MLSVQLMCCSHNNAIARRRLYGCLGFILCYSFANSRYSINSKHRFSNTAFCTAIAYRKSDYAIINKNNYVIVIIFMLCVKNDL